jgi:hypothetical protein
VSQNSYKSPIKQLLNAQNIKKEVLEQLEKEFPNWKRLPKNMKKSLLATLPK